MDTAQHRIRITTTLTYQGDRPHESAYALVEIVKAFALKKLGLMPGIDQATVTAAVDTFTPEPVLAIAPHQLNKLSETMATVTYPIGETTVISVQPDGRIELRPEHTAGPYETCLVSGDRLIYAPQGVGAATYLLPFAAQIPNV